MNQSWWLEIRWNYDFKRADTHTKCSSNRLWALQVLFVAYIDFLHAPLHSCTGVCENPFVWQCHPIDLCVSHSRSLTPFFCSPFVNFTLLGGKSMWHAWFLRDVLSALRWEAKPGAGSGAGCPSWFSFKALSALGRAVVAVNSKCQRCTSHNIDECFWLRPV